DSYSLSRSLIPRACIAILCLQLAACASWRDGLAGAWPTGIPPRSYFVEVYEADAENQLQQSVETYLYWVRSFYEGTTLY
ncbi:unnamed protein product, partial [Ectocarpus sp. 12 AP-2014]